LTWAGVAGSHEICALEEQDNDANAVDTTVGTLRFSMLLPDIAFGEYRTIS